jgi:hypothetical protein
MRSMVEAARCYDTPSTILRSLYLLRMVPLPRFAGQESARLPAAREITAPPVSAEKAAHPPLP